MSPQNVDIVRAAYEAWNSGDTDALRELLHPDVIARMPEGWPEPGPFVGREAVVRLFEQWRETFDTYVTELIGDIIEAADLVFFLCALPVCDHHKPGWMAARADRSTETGRIAPAPGC